MGVYDTVLVPCPKCGQLCEAQSKSGDCLCRTYTLDEAPSNVLENVNRHAPFECHKCGTYFYVDLRVYVKAVAVIDYSHPIGRVGNK